MTHQKMPELDAQEYRNRLWEYVRSRHSVADDDQLKINTQRARPGTRLTVGATSTDSIGDPFRVSLQATKLDTDKWHITEDQSGLEGTTVPSSIVSHQLTWMLREHNVHIYVYAEL